VVAVVTNGMGDLVEWVGDSLHSLLGFTDRTLAQYFVAVAAKAKNPAALLSELEGNDVPVSDAARSFAVELYKRAPRKAAPQTAAAVASSNAAELRRSQQYKLVTEEVPKVAVAPALPPSAGRSASATAAASVAAPSASMGRASTLSMGVASAAAESSARTESVRREDRRRHVRRREEDGDSGDDNAHPSAVASSASELSKRPRMAAAAAPPPESALPPEELARLVDQRERDEFEQRLLLRDEAAVRARAEEREALARKAADGGRSEIEALLAEGPGAGSEVAFDLLRKVSRRQYLDKREKQQLELLRDSIRLDEELLRGGERFTGAERRRFEMNKRILALATAKVEDSRDDEDRYHLPDAMHDDDGRVDAQRRESLLHKRYVEPAVAAKHRSDQEAWEAQQAGAASLRFGARDRTDARPAVTRRVERVRKLGADGRFEEVEVVVEEEDLSRKQYDLVFAGEGSRGRRLPLAAQ